MSQIVILFFLLIGFSQITQGKKIQTSVEAKSGPVFKKGTIKFNKTILNAEFALTNEQHQTGLMNRMEIPENFGMLFVFENEDYRSFWMKNTFIDLSIAYIGENRKILEIIDMKSVKSSLDVDIPSYPSTVKAMYALEVNMGWFQRNKIKVGDKMKSFTFK